MKTVIEEYGRWNLFTESISKANKSECEKDGGRDVINTNINMTISPKIKNKS